MGNQLVGVAPSQIFPVEHYLSDHVDLTFDQSLGSTRFFKVARARTREGLVVVKVFAVHDPSLPLAEHKERILKIKEQLASAFNCLPFQRVILTDKAGLLMREYCKCSVYDRMSTRPFLTVLEKKWITFQVLYALHRMHKLGICHGDIKLENIMVTSWLWVLLTDIASFKPTFLPDDNPADFSYFFDTSRRRLCYVAPERFVGAPDPNARPLNDDRNAGLLLSESPCKIGELVPSMDIFSTGCALLELWNDGTPALDLPGLLAYRNGEPRPPTMTLPDTCEPLLRDLLHSMTERNPKDRRSAELYLDEARGRLFPEYFYSFLQSYMLIFSAQPILPADEKITRIHQDIKNIIKIFTQTSNTKNYQDLVDETTDNQKVEIDALIKEGFRVMTVNVTDFEEEAEKTPENKELGPDSEGLILITSLVTSCIRGLHHCTSKLYCLEILQLLCENSSSEIILDRILPFIIYLSHASEPRVRAASIWCVSRCVSCVRSLPPSDCNVFPEYVLPELAPRASDPALPVRIAYANNIAKLAETAVRFLDQTQNMADKEAANINYETELSALHEMVRSTVSYLLTDSQAVVKRALVENGITKLCVFFGKQKANDVILSHMVTFLNDKEEVSLRGCFFERVVGVAAYVGHHAATILLPLLQQGLTDQSEWIIAKALRATTSLAELGLLPKQSLCDLVAESSVYLAHPNLWIRHEVCGLVSCVASLLNPIDVNCKILPLVWPHLKHKLMQVDRAELLLESVAEPIPRKVLDAVLRHGDVDRLVITLRERRSTRMKVKQGVMPQYSEMGQQLKNLFRRLASDGMTEHVENQLLAMSAHLIKIQSSSTQHITDAPGKLVLIGRDISKSVQLETQGQDVVEKMYVQSRRTNKTSLSHETHMNTEWQHMFGQTTEQSTVKVSESQAVSSVSGIVSTSVPPSHTHSQLAHSATYVQYSMAPCRIELRNLISRMQQKFQKSLRSHDDPVEAGEDLAPPASWRPGNTLLAYLHEHRARVNQLVRLPAHRSMFGSCSDDGTVRLWDAARLQGHAYVNKSKCVYNRGAGPVVSLCACEGGHSLAAGTADGSVPCQVTHSPKPTEDEILFILTEVKNYLNPDVEVRRGDVLSAWSGIRPLVSDPNKPDTQSLARNHIVHVSPAGLVTIAGGKWTTYRAMAAEAVDAAIESSNLKPLYKECQTDGFLIEGAHGWTPTMYIRLVQDFGLEMEVAQHLAKSYGDRAFAVAKMAAMTGKRWPIIGKKIHPEFPYIDAEIRYGVREYACTAVDMIARRLRLAFLNVQAAAEALPAVIEIMAEELKWNETEKQAQTKMAAEFLANEMGQMVNRASRDKIPINLNKEEIQTYIKRFQIIDKDRKGFVSINDIRRSLKNYGEDVTGEQLHEILREIDTNMNGQVELDEYLQMMSAIKSGHVAYSRFARMAELEEEHHEKESLKKKITVERSGGGL